MLNPSIPGIMATRATCEPSFRPTESAINVPEMTPTILLYSMITSSLIGFSTFLVKDHRPLPPLLPLLPLLPPLKPAKQAANLRAQEHEPYGQ